MSKIEKYLSDFDDYELAFFAKYRLKTYLKDTQEKIERILFKRGLTNHRIEQLIEKNPKKDLKDDNERCPRCFSDKIRKDKVEWTNTSGYGIDRDIATFDGISGKATYKDEIKCNVCGFWINDPNDEKPTGFMTKILGGLNTVIDGFLKR